MEKKENNKKERKDNILFKKLEFKNTFPLIFYNRNIMFRFWQFLDEKSITTMKNCLKKTGTKENKKKIKERVVNYVIDFGKHNDKVKYYLTDEGNLNLSTSIFNLNKDFLKDFTHIIYKNEKLELEEKELYEYLRIYPQKTIILSNSKKTTIKVSKSIVCYDYFDLNMKDKKKSEMREDTKENPEDKYKMFYSEENLSELKNIDFSNRETLIERQKKILEKMKEVKKIDIEFYPLKFISNVNYWCIILCEGGYFAYGFFLKDKEIEHKSDHKYVVRKKAGQRQVLKDQSKNIISIGAQIRRANEKKHQENIDLILKLNEEQLNKSDCIFIQAPGVNRQILIGGDKPLTNYKNKLYNLPFSIMKANYTNICYAFKVLTSTYLEIDDENIKSLFK